MMDDYKELDRAVSVLSSYVDLGDFESQDAEFQNALSVVNDALVHFVADSAEMASAIIVAFESAFTIFRQHGRDIAIAIGEGFLANPVHRHGGYDPFDARSMWPKPVRNDFVCKRPLVYSHVRYRVRRTGFRRANY